MEHGGYTHPGLNNRRKRALFQRATSRAEHSEPAPRPPSTRNALPWSEDKIHRYLVLALGVVAGAWLYARGPGAGDRDGARSDARGPSEREELTRPALDAAITKLARWIERSPSPPRTPFEANLRLLALGRAALAVEPGGARPPALANLDLLAGPPTPAAQPAALSQGTERLDDGDGDPLATLAILLETGIALDEPLPLAIGPTRVGRLLELALPRASGGSTGDPWSLDLLAFAVLGGMSDHRGELVRATLANLSWLERELRPWSELLGDGTPAAGALERRATELRQRGARDGGRGRELQASAAVFRAVAVLGEAELEQRALRHLNALVYRQQLERNVQRQRIDGAADAAERAVLRVEAIEELGRLEQALYGAHLTFRSRDRPGPPSRAAVEMRRAARDLIDHLEALERSADLDPEASPGSGTPSPALVGAATQALRGLRAARVATLY
jgi:hypothetical protein